MKITFDNVVATVEFANQKEKESFDKLKKSLTVMAPGAEYTKLYKQWKISKGKSGWSGQVNLINDAFATGLLPTIKNLLWNEFKILPTLVDTRPGYKVNPFVSTLPLKDYQEIAFKNCINNTFNNMNWPRGIIQLATGGGKTHIAMALYQYYNEPTLFLVHRKDLVTQTAERFKQFLGITPTIIMEGAIIPGDKTIAIATIQTLTSLIKNGLPFLNGIKQVIFDEAHLAAASLAKGNNIVKTAAILKNAHIRWGLTATPFMRDKYSNWLLKGISGEIVYTKSSKDLIDTGYLTPPRVKMIEAATIEKCPETWPACYDSGIVLNSARNEQIIEELKTIDKPCIIMCRQIAHANIIQNYARKAGIFLPILQGSSPMEEREDTIEKLVSKKLDAIICTTIFDEGIDIPELRSIILAGAGKSQIKQIQRIGRLLRKAEGKHEVTVIDFIDTSSKVLKRHSKERIQVCKEQGFKING